jgi:hypothetical protein
VGMEAVVKKGDEVNDGDIRRTTFKVEGMDCADEVRLIEDKLEARYSTGSGSDRAPVNPSLPLPVPYRSAPSSSSN